MFSMVRRFISLGACLLALASNPLPAQAAGTITVGDDGASCHGSVPTIQAAVTALGPNPGKIVVCAGTYQNSVVIAGANKLKLIGKPGAVLKAPAGFTGVMLTVQNSNKVTIQGLTFDGQSALGVGGGSLQGTAIYFYRSSGVITRNNIIDWHTPGFATSNYYITGIRVEEDAGQSISITKNTISDFQSRGISVAGPAKVTITRNTLSTTGTSVNKPVGIIVGNNLLGGKITGNTVTSDQFPAGSYEQVGIWVFEGSNFKITGNTVTHWYWGITLESDGYSTNPTNNNKVSGNKILETAAGIFIRSNAWGTYDAHADSNRITGNKITNTVAQGIYGIVVMGGNPAGGPDSFAQNEVVKGNKITNFAQGVMAGGLGNTVVTGVFSPNKIY